MSSNAISWWSYKALLCSRDGYDALALAPVLVDEECAPNLTQAVQNHFQVRRLGIMMMMMVKMIISRPSR